MRLTTSTPATRRGRPPDPDRAALGEKLIAIVNKHKRMTVRGVFYQAVILMLLAKTDSSVRKVQSLLLQLRRAGRIGYNQIVDESRIVYGNQRYTGLADMAEAAAELYHSDYWNHVDTNVQIWVEKRGLAGLLKPTVVHKWGLDLYVAGGQASESYIYVAGNEIAQSRKPTHAYVLTDFDPGGGGIFKALNEGTEDWPGGISRFTKGVPVTVTQLALKEEQVKSWGLPTRPLKMSDSKAKRFLEKYGDVSCELDAIEPAKLIALVDGAIASHMPREMLERLQNVEEAERETLRIVLESLAGDEVEDDEDEYDDVDDED